ncbi:cell wall-binding repeat-containing protein [Sutcliffiella halmapala]|uniref:cell wall-binding repeat-containing protein n=1 Tax=Sutcliffiella halmapala TaxID=79882 RepID=UPI000995905E|nr:cell wall-binding repeat-containing protein [Sutcliffiella halmapala]
MSKNLLFCNIVRTIVCLIPVLFFLQFANETLASEKTINRISGDNRYKTAVEVSKQGWPKGTNTVVISVGNNFPDALAGTPLAYSLDAPILLTDSNYVPKEIQEEISRLKASKAVILGGTGVVTEKVEVTLVTMGLSVERIAGRDRFETTVNIANKLPSKDTAIVAYGRNFPDSLAIASYAAVNGYPIFLVENNSIPLAVKKELSKYSKTIVVGGEGVISRQVFQQLPTPVRVAGSSRFGTAATVSETLQNPKDNVYIATGMSFADALTGSVLAAKDNTSILLVEKNSVPSDINRVIQNNTIKKFEIIGGESVVSENVSNALVRDLTKLISTAKNYIGTPYVWGGTTPNGFDCSGYTQFVFKQYGIHLPRQTSDQWSAGKSISAPQVGDLVFFETYQAGPSHVGIYIGNNEFIHAGSTRGVEITSMSNSYWSPRYLGAKRVIN